VRRSTLLAVLGGLSVALATAGAAAVPSASGAPHGARVIEVTTDTPLGTASPRHPGAPVDPGPYSVQQPDGSRITITAWGDSRTSGYQTKGGYAVTKDASGTWRYAVRLDASGRPVASDLEVGRSAPPAAARGLRAEVAEARAPRRAPGTGNGPQPGLVILVSFANQASVGSTEDQWAQQFFGADGSVSAYYQANSFGKFSLVPAPESAGTADNGVVGWLQLPYDHPNFGNDFDASETKLGVDAVKAADPYVDYASFDTDKNGSLSVSELHVTVIVAGYETSYGGAGNVCGNSVWGHHGGLYGSAPELDGTVVNRRGGTMLGEWMCQPGNAPGQRSTIGVMVHEIGHDIGLPDLYDTDFTSAGVAKWSAMSTGSWNRVGTAFSGSTPAGMDAFSKSYQGWLAPTPVVGAVNGAPLPSSATSPTAYRLGANPRNVDWKFEVRRGAGEYFLVENRQLVGWDAGLPACGVIVYHVDEGVRSSNKANADESHRLVDVLEADGSLALDTYGYLGSAADVFPGSSGHVDFTDATSPAATLYSGQSSGAAMHVNGGCADPMSANLFTPLPNDSFATAIGLAGTRGTVTGANNGASKEAGEPAVAANAGGASVWYRFRSPATGTLRLSTEGSTFNTLLGVYRGTSVAALKEVASNDDVDPTTGWSLLEAKVRRGVTYRIAVDGQDIGAGPGQGLATLGYRYWPANDGFAPATKLTGKSGKKVSSNAGAGRQSNEPRRIAGKKAGQSVWYVFRAKSAGRLTVRLAGARFDTVLGVYTGKLTKLHAVAADDDAVSFPLAKGTKYHLVVAGVKSAEGRFTLRWHSSVA
jgi:M6 family metalloprotease-like protein